MPSLHRSIILVGGITFFWLIEYAVPLFKFKYKKFSHAWPNIFFTLTTVMVNLVMAVLLLKTSDWVIKNNFGLLQWLPEMPLWLYVVLGVALLDLIAAWFAHWIQHRLKFLWMFHLIHHTDNNVDTTTANRHHPGESVVRFFFTVLGTFILGLPIGVIMLYQSMSVVFSQFNHANISLPKKVDDIMSWIIVSPDMHKVHHHYVMPYTDTNYGNIFSIWDRLFGTFAKLDNNKIVYGVDTYPDEKENTRIAFLLKLPFGKYRPPVGEKAPADQL
ncbi:sterol desaturase family protein [Abyssalbus ytuae]|uniref:Sterol desaturase family protein n=1 Tax=Abyssalbus ytuae TaxID=2926907 RepID=A0A9E7CU59_9FLAO|nr:sterol desaturase family protein [Abyssalbus ytuae]UOB19496.1 sterol desaturase family protein [Abyssalbus ytuae]